MGRGSGTYQALAARARVQPCATRFRQGIEVLDEHYAFFLTHVLNIGKPLWTDEIDTAAVALNPDTGDFFFVFNPDFAEKLDAEEMAFVAAHETLHILLNHLRLAKDYPDNHQGFNLAADAVINDYLAESGFTAPEGVVSGLSLVGEDCSRKSVREVYDLLQAQGGAEAARQAAEAAGTGGTDIDEHNWMHDADEAAAQLADTVFKQAQGDMPYEIADMRQDIEAGSASTSQGNGPDTSTQAWRQEHGVSLQWQKLLEDIDPDIFRRPSIGPPPRPSFHRRPRKLGAFPDLHLPVTRIEPKKRDKAREKPSIVMALDTSGSIDRATANRFVTLARSIPQDKVDLHVCTFTTTYRQLDLDNPRFPSGGTNFSAIERFIRDRVLKEQRRYPKAVVVITDGQAQFRSGMAPSSEQTQSWHWLLTNSGRISASHIMPGTRSLLSKYT
jgi:predicted metal-dependent peptidase